MTRTTLSSFFALALVLSGCNSGAKCSPAAATPSRPSSPTVQCVHGRAFVIVRHGEKASADKDTGLSSRGWARAKAIGSMLAHSGVTRLVATQYRRTQETLEPLASRLSLKVDVRGADKSAELVKELDESPDGAVVVLASHSNVIPGLVRGLAGTSLAGVEGDTLPDDDYRRVIVITRPCEGKPYVFELSSETD